MSVQKPCLFLDRDGVIIKNVPYTRDPNAVELLHGSADLIKQAHAKNFWVIMVTNQSGIGRGLLTPDDYQAITERMNHYLALQGARLDRIYHAPYYGKSLIPEFLENAHWRKPQPGMIHQACEDFPIDLAKSVMVGDRSSDIELAQIAGIGRKILYHSDYVQNERNELGSSIIYEEINDLSKIIL